MNFFIYIQKKIINIKNGKRIKLFGFVAINVKLIMKGIKKMKKNSQINAIREHLKKKKSITSWEAIEKYGATRLSGIIYVLKHKEGWNIKTKDIVVKNRFGNHCTIAKYELIKGV